MIDLFKGNMDAILEYLQAQKVTTSVNNIVVVVVVTSSTNFTTTVIDVTVAVENSYEIVIHLVVSHPIFQTGPSRHDVVYTWGMPSSYTPQSTKGSAFILYQPFVVPHADGNSVAFPQGMPTHHSLQVVNADNHEIPQGQTHQTSMSVNAEIPDDTDTKYRDPFLHFQIPPQTIQFVVQNPYQFDQNVYSKMCASYPGASTSMMPHMPVNTTLQLAH